MLSRARKQADRSTGVAVVAGSSSPVLASAIARDLGVVLAGSRSELFPDGEVHVEVDPAEVHGRTVAIVQSTSRSGGDHLLELLLLADACRRSGARAVLAVIPYFGYARHDRRKEGEALGVRVVADAIGTAAFEHVFAVDVHSEVTEASLRSPMTHLSAVSVLADAMAGESMQGSVVVAPDLGAVRLAREYARRLALPLAFVHKVRKSATEVVALDHVTGDVRGRRPIIVDDMIATGATVVAAARAVEREGAAEGFVLAATHAVLTPGSAERLSGAGLQRLFVTDTIPPDTIGPRTSIVSIASLVGAALRAHAAPGAAGVEAAFSRATARPQEGLW